MNYGVINTAILSTHNLPKSFVKDSNFYDYLLSNNVAYYYSSLLSTEKTIIDKKIIAVGKNLNNKYIKTLKFINQIAKENGIKFLLFKTYKYIPEVVDNDIDLLIKEKDFYQFMKILKKKGFSCVENEPLKGICKKKGLCTIEPRTSSSFHGLIIMNEQQLWDKIERVNIGGITIFKPVREVEIAHLLLSLLYNPNYLKLYLLLVYRNSNLKRFNNLNLEKDAENDLKLVIENLLTKEPANKRFPSFIGNFNFITWWYKRIFSNPKLTIHTRLKHILFFFYLKYSYVLFNRLVFKHEWPLDQEIK